MRFKKIKLFFEQGTAAREVATLTIGTAIAQGITIAATPLLSRLYTPSDFGLLALFMAVASVGATFVTLRYETSILVPVSDSEAANLVIISSLLALGLAFLMGWGGLLLPSRFLEDFGLEKLGTWFPIVFLTAATMAIFAVVQGWLNRKKEYKKMSILRVGQSAGLSGFSVLFWLLSIKDGLLFSQVIASGIACFFSLWLGRSAIASWKKKDLIRTIYTHKNAPKYLLPTALLDAVTLQLPLILIAMWFGESVAGQFGMAWRLLMIPMALIGGAIGQVFMQRFSQIKDNPLAARQQIRKTWIFIFLLGILPFFIIFSCGEFIFEKSLGEQWTYSGSVAVVMAPMVLAMFVSSPTSGTYILLGLQKYSLLFGVAVFIFRPLCIYVGKINNDFFLGLKLWVIFEIIQIVIYQSIAWKKIGGIK
jgi:O-antigen/teichoic acid export membrane protein